MMNIQKSVAKPTVSAKPAAAKAPIADIRKASAASVASLLVSAAPAFAATEDAAVDGVIDGIIGAVKAAGSFVKSGVSVAEAGIEIVKEGVEVATPVVQKGVEAVSPYVSSAYSAAVKTVEPVVKASIPAINSAINEAGLPISETTTIVTKTADQAITVASPVINKTATFLSTADPVTLGEYALGAVALVYLTPSILGAIGGSLRGYAGELTAAATQDKIVNDGALLIDIRTAREKEASGVPDLPSAASSKFFEVEYAATEDRRLRASLKDASALEAQVTALQIASLKRVSKGNTIVLLDRFGATAKAVAKELSAKGYGKVYVLAGGFDGRGGWVSSKLQIKPAATAVSAPSTSVATIFSRKALSAPKA